MSGLDLKAARKILSKPRESLYGFKVREDDRRRKPREEKKTHDIQQMWQRSHEILNMNALGMKGTEIAEVLSISEQTVSNTINSTLGENKLSDIREERDEKAKELREKIDKLTEKALETYNEILDNDTASLNLKKSTADTIVLDLAGHRAPTKIQSQHAHVTATIEEIEAFKKRGLAAARESGMVIEVVNESGEQI